MKFSQNGYYIEKYVKCTNCGVLIYEGENAAKYIDGNQESPYCTQWCVKWAEQRMSGIENPVVTGSFDT